MSIVIPRPGRGRRQVGFALLAMLGLAASAGSALGNSPSAPLTPWGVAPLVHRGTTHPDSIESALALVGNQEHRPLSLATATRGLEQLATGSPTAAIQLWEDAHRYDPTYVAPGLAPARLTPQAQPRQSFHGLLQAAEAMARGFINQQITAANLLILIFIPTLFAAVACALLLIIRHAASLHHLFWEHLQPVLPRFAAKWAVWGLFFLPIFWNLGLLLWSALLLATVFPLLGRPEKRFAVGVAVLLLIAPLGVRLVAAVVAPADPAHVTHALWRAQQSGHSPETLTEIRRLERRYPNNGLLEFTESLLARQLDDLPTAREALARAQAHAQLHPSRFDAAWAVMAYKEGKVEEAIRRLASAAEADPSRYDLHYNLSKAYARASLFLKADRAMRRAFELDAARVRREERRRLEDRVDDLIEERLRSADLWGMLLRTRENSTFQMPAFVSILFPGGNPQLMWAGFLVLPLVVWGSLRCSRRLIIHTCSQCGKRVCRRCLKRRERRVFCSDCVLTIGRWAQAQYTQVLLTRLLGRHDRLRDRLLSLGKILVPGLGAAMAGRINRAFVQLLWLAMGLTWLAVGGLPIKPLPWSALDERVLPTGWIAVVALVVLEVWIVRSELHGLRRRATLKEFLSSARLGQARDAA